MVKQSKKGIILVFVFLLCSVSVMAELVMTPNPVELSVKSGESSVGNVTLRNTFGFRIQSFEFSNLDGFTFPSIVLEPNESRVVDFSVLRSDLGTKSLQSIVSFRYLVDIPQSPVTHHINLSSAGFSPNFLELHEGDTVVWHNVDDISHTVSSSNFEIDLPVNGTGQRVFNSIETVFYTDAVLFWSGSLEVLSRSVESEVHNPNYDKTLRVDLSVLTDPTNISLTLAEDSFSVDTSGEREGLISIKNIGSEIAQSVTLSSGSNWISFDENNFNLESQETNHVTFRVKPLVLATNETNRTYNFDLTVKGLNTEQRNVSISVFVPYSNVFDDLSTDQGFLAVYLRFCEANPSTLICNNTIGSGGGGQIITVDPQIPVNLSASQFYDLLRRQQRMEDALQRNTNLNNRLTELLDAELPKIKEELNASAVQEAERLSRSETIERTVWVGVILLIIGFVVYFIISKVREKKKQDVLREW